MATYPSQVLVKGNVINEVDVVDQNDHNILKNEIIALQSYVGTNPQGGFSDFASRVNNFLNGTGVVVNSNGFPALSTPLRMFYRTDAETLYIRRFDNTAWQAIGASQSNVVFQWHGKESSTVNGTDRDGIYYGTSSNPVFPNTVTGNNFFIVGGAANTYTLMRSKFYKIQGITTLLSYVRMWNQTTGGAGCKAFIDINSSGILSSTPAVTSTSPSWVNHSIDVSGLTNGTAYDLLIKLTGDGREAYLSSIILYGQ